MNLLECTIYQHTLELGMMMILILNCEFQNYLNILLPVMLVFIDIFIILMQHFYLELA